jgi:hypothetical protein
MVFIAPAAGSFFIFDAGRAGVLLFYTLQGFVSSTACNDCELAQRLLH